MDSQGQQHGYSRSLSGPEIEKLRTEFPQLAEVTTFSTDRIKSIRVRVLTQEEFDSFLKKTFGDRYNKGPSTKQSANEKYEVSFFNYTEEQKAEMKRKSEEGETSP